MTRRAFKVTLKTTNVCGDRVHNKQHLKGWDEYIEVEAGLAYVLTEDPKRIYDYFGVDNVLNIERIGKGYALQ